MGKQSGAHQDINIVMKHEFLRRSMEQRIENKVLDDAYKREQAKMMKDRRLILTKAATLRSQSVLNSIKGSKRYGSPNTYQNSEISQSIRSGKSQGRLKPLNSVTPSLD